MTFTLIAVLFAIIAIGIANTMVISVRERRREIGTSRAIGMSRPAVLVLFMLETLILSLFATVVGGALGALISVMVDAAHIEIGNEAMRAILLSDVLSLDVDLNQILFSIVLLTGFSALSALLPALRAARMQPVEALQSVE